MSTPLRSNEIRCFRDLEQRYTEGVDYAIRVVSRERSRVAIVAPHGGRIEGRTSEVARLIAGDEHRLYLFEGLRPNGDNFDCLHLASHRFDEPRALELIANCDTVIAVHGYAAAGPDVLLGGLDERLKREIERALLDARVSCLAEGHRFPGKHPHNICNRGRSGAGVQLELSEGLRKAGNWRGVAAALRDLLRG